MLTGKKISIIVICYNDGGSIWEMYRRVTDVMRTITPNYEIVYVNDASPDHALEVLREIASCDQRLVVFSHSRNFGAQAAYMTGLQYCTGDAAIMLDGDIQDPPELFPELVKKWLSGFDIIYGERVRRKGSRLWNIFYKFFYRLFRKLAYIQVPLDAGDFGLIDRKIINIINQISERDLYFRGLRAWVGFKSISIPYDRSERYSGVTNNSFLWSIHYAKKLILSFSYKPLEWISYLAFFIVALTAVSMVFNVVLYLILPNTPRGIPTLIMLILFLGGIQLFAIAVIGEYLGKIFEEIQRRPRSLIQETMNYQGSKPINQF